MAEKRSRISRRDFFKMVAAGAAVCGGTRIAAEGGKADRQRPNVLLIIGDDLRPQLGCYGETQMVTPHIDRLAAQGMLFERSYCQQALCAPSRASLLTGLRPESTKIFDLNKPVSQALPDRVTLPGHFKKNGYETISLGKVYHHTFDDPLGWSRKPYKEKGSLYASVEGGKSVKANQQANPELPWPLGVPTEAAPVADQDYIDGRLTDRAIAELARLKDRPFFLCIGFSKPHLPFNAPKKYWDKYDADRIGLAPNSQPPLNIPPFSLGKYSELRYFLGIPKGNEPITEKLARQLVHGYYACVSFLDAQVGRLLVALDNLKLRDRTIVVLWGDNGFKLGEHGSWSKSKAFETDTRVPLIVSAPGMKNAGQRTRALVEAVDIYPSLGELAGLAPTGQPLEGISFVPVLENPARPWKRAAFSLARSGPVTGCTMRTERYRFVEWRNNKDGRTLARELYDHRADPLENVNVASDPLYGQAATELGEWLRGGWRGALPVPEKVAGRKKRP